MNDIIKVIDDQEQKLRKIVSEKQTKIELPSKKISEMTQEEKQQFKNMIWLGLDYKCFATLLSKKYNVELDEEIMPIIKNIYHLAILLCGL